MTRAVWQNTVCDAEGDVVSGAYIEVRNAFGGALAALYDARSGGAGISNPALSDGDGFRQFYVEEGTYHIYITHPSIGTRTYLYVVLLSSHLSMESVGILSHPPSGAQADNYNCSGGLNGNVGFLELAPLNDIIITGLSMDGPRNGMLMTVTNVSVLYTITFKANSTDSAVGHRIRAAYDFALPPGGASVMLRYSSGLDCWLLIP